MSSVWLNSLKVDRRVESLTKQRTPSNVIGFRIVAGYSRVDQRTVVKTCGRDDLKSFDRRTAEYTLCFGRAIGVGVEKPKHDWLEDNVGSVGTVGNVDDSVLLVSKIGIEGDISDASRNGGGNDRVVTITRGIQSDLLRCSAIGRSSNPGSVDGHGSIQQRVCGELKDG